MMAMRSSCYSRSCSGRSCRRQSCRGGGRSGRRRGGSCFKSGPTATACRCRSRNTHRLQNGS